MNIFSRLGVDNFDLLAYDLKYDESGRIVEPWYGRWKDYIGSWC